MTGRSAIPDLPPGAALGVLTLDIASAAAAGGGPPEWIKITPAGEVRARDGRVYTFNAETLVARFEEDGIHVPIDLDHAVAKRAMWGERADAQGWVTELDARDDGLWGKVDWLDGGKAVLAARTHRYISPTFHHDEANVATWLHSVALVTAPAFAMPAVAAAGGASKETRMKKIAAALGLAEGADETACLAAITSLKAPVADKDEKIDKAVHDQALANLATAQSKLTELQGAQRKAKVDEVIEGALKAKKIVPAQKEAYLALCATDAGLDQVKALLEATPASLQATGLDGERPGAGDEEVNPVALAAAATAHMNKLRESGVVISYADAVAAVSEAKQ